MRKPGCSEKIRGESLKIYFLNSSYKRPFSRLNIKRKVKVLILLVGLKIFGFMPVSVIESRQSLNLQPNIFSFQNGVLIDFDDIEISPVSISFVFITKSFCSTINSIFRQNKMIHAHFNFASKQVFNIIDQHFVVPLVHSP